MCVFEDGYECEEWAYYNGECSPEDIINERRKQLKGEGKEKMKEYCDCCGKEVECKYGIDWYDGYSRYCNKKCAKKDLNKHKEDFIYKL